MDSKTNTTPFKKKNTQPVELKPSLSFPGGIS